MCLSSATINESVTLRATVGATEAYECFLRYIFGRLSLHTDALGRLDRSVFSSSPRNSVQRPPRQVNQPNRTPPRSSTARRIIRPRVRRGREERQQCHRPRYSPNPNPRAPEGSTSTWDRPQPLWLKVSIFSSHFGV